jgi:asparagine synthetase B (glutamine-hydrolysing)
MCGIHCIVAEGNGPLNISSSCRERLLNRGPDFISVQEATIGLSTLRLTSTVLSLRGDQLTKQPFFDEATGSILAWNGEAWHVGNTVVQGNDGAAIFGQLVAACHPTNEETEVLQILRSIQGPFAFVFFSGLAKKIYFGRDRLGRRSLLYHFDDYKGTLRLCSVAEGLDAWREVAADVVHVVDMAPLSYDYSDGRGWTRSYHLWSTEETQAHIAGIGPFNMADAPHEPSSTSHRAAVAILREKLAESLRLRVQRIPRPPNQDSSHDIRLAVLFSGGLDCSILAKLAHELVPLDQGIDLLNVAFENPRIATNLGAKISDPSDDIYEACPDRITGRKSFAELLQVSPGRSWCFVAVYFIEFSAAVIHELTRVTDQCSLQ